MKNLTLLLFIIGFTATTFAQDAQREKLHYKNITQKECVKKKGYRLLLKQVISDSRCPENVTCIWAGEVSIVVSVYKDKKFEADETLTLSPKNRSEINAWFSKYTGREVASVALLPYPKEGVVVDPKTYSLRIGYIK